MQPHHPILQYNLVSLLMVCTNHQSKLFSFLPLDFLFLEIRQLVNFSSKQSLHHLTSLYRISILPDADRKKKGIRPIWNAYSNEPNHIRTVEQEQENGSNRKMRILFDRTGMNASYTTTTTTTIMHFHLEYFLEEGGRQSHGDFPAAVEAGAIHLDCETAAI